MLRISMLSTAFLAAALLITPSKGWAGTLPEGVTVQMVAEYTVPVSGLEKVVLQKVILEPGATWTVTLKNQIFCNVTQGSVLVVDHETGSSTLLTTGSRLAPIKGHTVTVSNPGDETHVHWVYALIEKKSPSDETAPPME